ncbi:ParB/RepB/Spo0J family partition protein [Burkholderia sp. BCC0322]|uniref:ParB/RepB/Spo0J family partition protein n=1 Tax=unclassified Burkholderia TaxID=2613784 RepID=UPI00158D22B3|nr:ParB/RepB/Spo0J family partition protein [Burkholderia sp. BCC0322]
MNAVITEIPALAHDAGVPPAPPEAHLQAGDERLIPLKRLVASPFNVRRTKRTGISALANNIDHVGLLQNIIVHPMKVGAKRAQTFGAAAGESRRLALLELVERGRISLDEEVRCTVVSVEAAVLISTSENEMREPMHPADQCDAYRVLVDAGRTVAEIAEIYGTTPQLVQRRLKLARVSPKLVDLFRADEIRADQMQALALSDSHAEQESAWFDAKPHDREPHAIRRKLVAGEHDFQSNRIALFVGIDAYEAAGGVVRRDLFSDQGTAWYADHALMERVAVEQLTTIAAKVQEEGWDWVEPITVFDYNAKVGLQRVPATAVPPTEAQQQEMDAIDARMEAIEQEQEADDIDEETYERLCDEETALSLRYASIEESLYVYTPLQMAGAGAVVTIDQDGALEVVRGWARRAEPTSVRDDETDGDGTLASAGETPTSPAASGSVAQSAPPTKDPHSGTLTLRLNARRTAVVGMALARQPHVALAVLVHRFLVTDYAPGSMASAIDIQWHDHTGKVERHATELADDLPYRLSCEQRGAWGGLVPNDTGALLTWCIEQSDERLMLILAQYVGASVDGVATDEGAHSINALIPALNLNLADEWKPTRASYFDHVSKARIAEVVTVAVSPAEGMRIVKLKKGDAATEAERIVSGTGWLPDHFARAETRSRPLWRNHTATSSDVDEEEDGDDDASGAHDADEANDGTESADVAEATDDSRDEAAVAEAEGMPPRD